MSDEETFQRALNTLKNDIVKEIRATVESKQKATKPAAKPKAKRKKSTGKDSNEAKPAKKPKKAKQPEQKAAVKKKGKRSLKDWFMAKQQMYWNSNEEKRELVRRYLRTYAVSEKQISSKSRDNKAEDGVWSELFKLLSQEDLAGITKVYKGYLKRKADKEREKQAVKE